MKAAVLHAFGEAPRYEEFPDPTPAPGEVLLEVAGSALSRAAYGMTIGGHYAGPTALPIVVGMDGVGRTPEGARVFAGGVRSPYGMMAELAAVPRSACVPVPEPLDDATAAALPNPAMASWAALELRARLTPGESVLILGATGTSGRLALPIARHLGARTVVVAGRNAEALEKLRADGADATISLLGTDAEVGGRIANAIRADPPDIIVDFLWGRVAALTLEALTSRGSDPSPAVRFVTVGSMEATSAPIPSAPFRSRNLQLLGSGLGSAPLAEIFARIPRVFALAAEGKLRIATEFLPLSEVERSWEMERPGRRRAVFRP